MNDPTDNVNRLERIARTMEAGHWRSSAKVVREAADEIERLRKERDEARREVCDWCGIFTKETPQVVALKNKWDCFKENTDA